MSQDVIATANVPSKILVTGDDATACNKKGIDISGIYEKVAQTRRGKPVWYNTTRNTYIYGSEHNKWYITTSEHFKADDFRVIAHSSMKNSSIWPTNIVYKIKFDKYWEDADCLHVLRFSGNTSRTYNEFENFQNRDPVDI